MRALKDFFNNYAGTFHTDNTDFNDCINLKITHSFRVLNEAENLVCDASETECRTLKFAALLHDLSRFEQIRDFGTFDDRASFDHGVRSAQIIVEENLSELVELTSEEEEAAIWAVEHHNKKSLPSIMPSSLHENTGRLLRDADKLDIYRVLFESLRNPTNDIVVWGSPDYEGFSDKIISDLLAGKAPDHRDFKSKADFLLSKLGWAYDLNSRRAKDEFIRRRYFEQMLEFLPQTPEVFAVYKRANAALTK